MKNKELQIAMENVSVPMKGKFSSLFEKVLNKSIPFNVLSRRRDNNGQNNRKSALY